MKTDNCSKMNKDNSILGSGGEKLMGRRELLNKAGWYALSATTMMVLLKSQPAKAQSLNAMPAPNVAPSSEVWQRTTRK